MTLIRCANLWEWEKEEIYGEIDVEKTFNVVFRSFKAYDWIKDNVDDLNVV